MTEEHIQENVGDSRYVNDSYGDSAYVIEWVATMCNTMENCGNKATAGWGLKATKREITTTR